MSPATSMPIFIQEDGTIFFFSNHPESAIVQPFLSEFAQLKKTPSHIHIYHLSAFSIWYAFNQGITLQEIVGFLQRFSGAELPIHVERKLKHWQQRNGLLQLLEIEGIGPCLYCSEKGLLNRILIDGHRKIRDKDEGEILPITIDERGTIKQQLMEEGFPVVDKLGVEEGTPLSVSLCKDVQLRPYQKEAVDAFVKPRGVNEGNGFIILPCGAGKTIVGLGILEKIKEDTLILVPNDTSLQQWYEELLDKTTLKPSQIGRYSTEAKEVKPVTIITYQMLTYYHSKNKNKFPHFELFHKRNWGLVIYDEVHLLPAPLFRITSNLQGKRRLGLTATFVREDGKEGDIYSLIGPKRYEVAIKVLENNGWLSSPIFKEIKVPFVKEQWAEYFTLSKRERFRFASENERKMEVVENLLKKHQGCPILIIGQYLNQLRTVANEFSLPLITGETKKWERKKIYQQFKDNKVNALVLSRVANLAVDLPNAQVAIQISGTYGSRQEEAQRIGRLLRPNKLNEPVYFYSLTSPLTQEEEVASHRQLFMTEQGYSYEWEEWSSCSFHS